MRWLVALLLLLPGPALAAGWGHYVNVRFGYAIDVPPGFIGGGESDNSDGQIFKTPTARLSVFGANVLEGDFESEVRRREGFAKGDGWGLTYQVSTPGAASFSGKHGARILYARAIPLCHDTQIGMFELEYSGVDLKPMSPVIDRLVASLKATQGSADCAP